jgi:hypothetical protein
MFLSQVGVAGVKKMRYFAQFYVTLIVANNQPNGFIREMPKTLEDVADLGSYICALDKG